MTITQDGYREVLLAGVPVQLRTILPETDLRVFPGKVTIGDYTEDSHPLLSTYVMSDFTGGLGVEDMNEGSDINRYKIATLYPRYPRQISKNYKINTVAQNGAWDATGKIRFLGDFYNGGWQGIIAVNTKLYTLAAPGTLRGTLTASPTGHSVMFQGTASTPSFVVPMGASGVARLSTGYSLTNTAASATCPAAIDLLVWDNKLIAVDTAGQLWFTTDVTGSWTSYGPTAKLPTGSTPRCLVPYFDRQGLPTVFIVTDAEVWQADLAGPNIFTVDVFFPPHPSHGNAACRWGGDLYFSVGLGVHRYTGGSLSAMGLDRDAGLFADYAGSIIQGGLIGGYNSMYALLDSDGTLASTSDPNLYSLHEWTGTGWHMIATRPRSAAGTVSPTTYSMGISRHNGNYRLYWGDFETVDGSYALYYIDLPKQFANPRTRALQNGTFQPGGFLITSIFDAAMKGYKKIANSVDVTIEAMKAGASLKVYYDVDDDINGLSPGTLLGTVTTTGTTTLQFGTLADGIYPGIVFERIWLQFALTDSSSEPFIMNSAVLSFIKTMPGSLTWTADVKLDTEYKGKSPAQLRQHITGILDNRAFVPMVKNGTTYRVYLSQVKGASESGFDERGSMQVSILQIPEGLGA